MGRDSIYSVGYVACRATGRLSEIDPLVVCRSGLRITQTNYFPAAPPAYDLRAGLGNRILDLRAQFWILRILSEETFFSGRIKINHRPIGYICEQVWAVRRASWIRCCP